MGLDIYAGSVTRYVAGDWLTIVQRAAAESGLRVHVLRPNEAADTIRDPAVIEGVVAEWRDQLLRSLDATADDWNDRADAPYDTDKPDWDGYGAVVLLAAALERPDLAPGATIRKGLRRSAVPPVLPRDYQASEVYRAASSAPKSFPTLLAGAEWCLPIDSGPTVFRTTTPNGTQLTMGRVDQLVEELHSLNEQTLRLSTADLAGARSAGPPRPGASVDDAAPFGLTIMLALAEFAVTNRAAWIMDYWAASGPVAASGCRIDARTSTSGALGAP